MSMMRIGLGAFSSGALFQICAAVAMAATDVPVDDRELALTFYRGEVALVQDSRSVTLPREGATLRWAGVAPGIHAGSVHLDRAGLHVDGFTLAHRPWSLAGLVEAHVGHEVRVVRGVGQHREVLRARVIATDPLLLENDDGVFHANAQQLVFPRGAPGEMGVPPALMLKTSGNASGEAPVVLNYLADGFQWTAEHVAALSTDGSRLDLVTRAQLHNASGMAVADARVDLVAGEVNIPRGSQRPSTPGRVQALASRAAQEATVEPAGDQYRFRLPGRVSLDDGERQSITLVGDTDIPVERSYAVTASVSYRGGDAPSGWQPVPVETRLQWTQRDGPLPAGTVRVYAREGESLRLVGGDHVPDRAEGTQVRIVPGRPFDVTARRRQTDLRRIDPRSYETAHEIRVHNARDVPVEMSIEETIPGDWRMLEASDTWERAASDLVTWKVTVPPGEDRNITYRVNIER